MKLTNSDIDCLNGLRLYVDRNLSVTNDIATPLNTVSRVFWSHVLSAFLEEGVYEEDEERIVEAIINHLVEGRAIAQLSQSESELLTETCDILQAWSSVVSNPVMFYDANVQRTLRVLIPVYFTYSGVDDDGNLTKEGIRLENLFDKIENVRDD